MEMGEEILRWKQKILQFYKNYELWIIGVLKFVGIALGVTLINQTMGTMELLTRSYVVMAIAFIGMFLPVQYIVMGLLAIITAHMFAINLIIGGISLGIWLCLYILVIRFYPKESILLFIMILACGIEAEYALTMIVSLFAGVGCVLPLIAGIVLHNFWQLIESALHNNILTGELMDIAKYMIDNVLKVLSTDEAMFATVIVVTIVYITVYAIRKQKIDYAPYLAIVIGGAMNILGVVFAILFLEIPINIVNVIIMTIASIIICMISEYIVRPADYSRAETVQFEDDDNYYFVKIVPKISTVSSKTHIEEIYSGEK